MLEEVYNSYRKLADQINWDKYNQNELFFKYIEHEDDNLCENFYAGIVCRYWGYTGRIYLQCNKHISFEQCYDILIDTINYVLDKRVWLNPESSLYNDSTAPDKAFHIVLKRQKSVLLSNLTAYKRKSNFNTLSIDEIHEKYADASEGLFELYPQDNSIQELVEYIRLREDSLEIIILDKICFDKWKTLKNVVKLIKKLDKNSSEYYNIRYGISVENYDKVITKISEINDSKLLFEIKKLLYILRKEYN